MDALFRPRSIAIVGASSDRNKPGGKVASYLATHGYQGTVVPISKSAGEIGGIRAYPDIEAYEGTIDVAVLAVPGAAVPDTLRKLATRQCSHAVVFASGFAELGDAGRVLQQSIRDQALASGIRLLGPNTQGFANLRDGVVCHFGTTLSDKAGEASSVAVVSQSGAASQILYSRLQDLGITPSFLTATGNEADISVSDVILWYLQQSDVDTVIAYAETLNDLPALSDAARLARETGKSIIFVKAGRTASGAQAASSHTGALTVEDSIASAFFEQSGILRATNLKQAAELAQMLMLDIRPRLNRRSLSISNSGASCVMSADAIESEGLSLASLKPETVKALRATLPDYVSAGNPIDMTTATLQRPRLFEEILEVVSTHDSVDLVHVAFPIGSVDYDFDLYARNLKQFQAATRACVAVSLNQAWARDVFRSHGLPVFDSEEDAVHALAMVQAWSAERVPPRIPAAQSDAAPGALRTCNELDSLSALKGAGLPVVEVFGSDRIDHILDHARAKADFPYVLKGVSDTITHKSDLGLVQLRLQSVEDIARAAETIAQALRQAGEPHVRYLLAPMIRSDLEIMMGATRHSQFGSVLVVAAGGVDVEAMNDTATVVLPARPDVIRAALKRLHISRRFAAHRNRAAIDVDALASVIHRFADWFCNQPGIHSVDVNPLMVDSAENRITIVDSVVTLQEKP